MNVPRISRLSASVPAAPAGGLRAGANHDAAMHRPGLY
jgi:hypothetical protein